jgi:hypothetical protein
MVYPKGCLSPVEMLYASRYGGDGLVVFFSLLHSPGMSGSACNKMCANNDSMIRIQS